MNLNLCPCMPLQKGVKLLAIIDGVLSIVNLLILTLLFILLISHLEELELGNTNETTTVAIIIIDVTFSIVQIFMAVKLYNGAKMKDVSQCRVWVIVTVILDVVEICSSFKSGEEMNGVSFRIFMVIFAYKLYVILVVLMFIKELTKTGTIRAAVVYNGNPSVSPPEVFYPTIVPHQNIYYTPVESNFQEEKPANSPVYRDVTESV